MTVGIGQQTGISIQIGASQIKGKADGDATTYDNTEIVAGKTLTLKSGQDTTLQGAQVAGERVVADIGGNLSIETLQDQSRYKNRQSESGFSVSLCIPPICYGASSGTVSAANQKIDHSYRSAQGQSGIAAGEGGFEINVGGNTHLKGAAITSQATADKNTLTTGSLSYEDLTNTQHTEASGSSFSFSGGTDISKSLLPTASNSLAGQAAGNLLGNLAAQNGLPEDKEETTQTLAVISPATITLTGTGNPDTDAASQQAAEALTQRDAATANQALTDTLTLQDAARIERQMQEAKQNAAAANLIGQTVAGLIGDLADQMKKPIVDASRRIELDQRQAAADRGGPPLTHVEQYELNRLNGEGMSSEKAAQTLVDPAAQANYNNWGEGSLNKTILHGLAGIIQAKVGDGNALVGAAAGALNEVLLPLMLNYLDAQNITDPEARRGYLQLASAMLGAGIGAIADGASGAALGGTAAYNATTYNYLTHATMRKVQDCLTGKTCANADEKRQVVADAEKISQQLDQEMQSLCTANPTGDACRTAINAATEYVAMKDAWAVMNGDVQRSSGQLFDYLYNSSGAENRFSLYYNTIDNRANFFAASNQYEQNVGAGAKWFGGADFISRAPITGLGAGGSYSNITFSLGFLIFSSIYDWRSEAGSVLMNSGFENFKNLYNTPSQSPVVWDINQLKSEQSALQSVHSKYLADKDLFRLGSKYITNTNIVSIGEGKQGQQGGIDILDYKSRIEFGCKLLGYSAAQGCKP